MNTNKKPPLGLIPRFIFLERRLDEIRAAVIRYWADDHYNNSDSIDEWLEEYLKIKSELHKEDLFKYE